VTRLGGRAGARPGDGTARPGGRAGSRPGDGAARTRGGTGPAETTDAYAGRIVTPDGVVTGTLRVEGGRISAIEPGPIAADAPWFVPGFVDMHCHGGGGHTFTTGDAEQARAAAAFHRGHGTTTIVASLVSSPFDVMLAATAAYAPLVRAGVLGGVHFEGPYLSEACCGAQNPAFLRDPSIAELAALLEAGGADVIRMMTIAPERDGGLEAIRFLTDRGVVASIGHTDATYRQVGDGIAAGATAGTHVFNGMKPPHHRTPGPAYALLGAPEIVCEFIADGVHLADETLEFAFRVTGRRAALITDAIAATGMADGTYELGGQAVEVEGGVARLAGKGAIAGSTLTMDAAFRRAARVTGSIVDAAHAASTTPARTLGFTDRGALAVGLRADIVQLDADLNVAAVISAD
jgi:N-acetylglucosamine-6-phosphate deacetylase